MDHLPWYSKSRVSSVKLPFICGPDPLCGAGEFFDFPQRQGWEPDESQTLAQLAARAQAWLFLGLLAVAGIPASACIPPSSSTTLEPVIETPFYLPASANQATAARTERCSDVEELPGDWPSATLIVDLVDARVEAENVMIQEIIPLVKAFDEEEAFTLWNSKFFPVLLASMFSWMP